MTNTHYFRGKSKWVKAIDPDTLYNCWSAPIVMNDESRERFDNSEFEMTPKPDTDGDELVTFRRPTQKVMRGKIVEFAAPEVTDDNGNKLNSLIGNGSDITVKVISYPYKFGGKSGFGHRLEAIRVHELVEYEAPDGGSAGGGSSTTSGTTSAPAGFDPF